MGRFDEESNEFEAYIDLGTVEGVGGGAADDFGLLTDEELAALVPTANRTMRVMRGEFGDEEDENEAA